MHTVVSARKPAREWLATAVAAGLMLSSMVAAWALVRARSFPADVDLAERFAPQDWPLVLYLPAGWVREAEPRESPVPILHFADGPPDEARRRLRVSRYDWGHYVPPAAYGAQLAARTVQLPRPPLRLPPIQVAPVTFGSLPGAGFVIQAYDGGAAGRYACAVGSSPTGESFALILESAWDRLDHDLSLIRNLAAAVEITDPALTDTPDFSQRSIQFEPPARARFHTTPVDDLERIQCLSPADAEHPWHLRVSRVWLAGDRSAEHLLKARVAETAPRDEVEIETHDLGSGTAYRAVLGLDEDQPDRLVEDLWCVPLGERSAAMIEGRADGHGHDDLARVCRRTAETVRPGPASSAVDVSGATTRGESIVRELGTTGLAETWGAPAGETWYEIRKLGSTAGFRRLTYGPAGTDKPHELHVFDVQFYQPPMHGPILYVSRWFVTPDLAADHGERVMEAGRGRDVIRYRSVVSSRNSGARQRRRDLDGRILRDTVDRDSTFVCEAALTAAQSMTARAPEKGPAIFTQSHLFDEPDQTNTIWCKPLGRSVIELSDRRADAWGLLVRKDHGSDYQMLHFDDDGGLLRESIEGDIQLRLMTRDEVEVRFGEFGSILDDVENRLK